MPIKSGKLTPLERKIAEGMAISNNAKFAAMHANVSATSGTVSKALHRPAVQAEIAAQQIAMLFEIGLPLAVQTHIDILTNDKAPAGARIQAVKLMYDRTLGVESTADRKEAHEMTADELAREIERLKREVSDRARPAMIDDSSATIDDSSATIDDSSTTIDDSSSTIDDSSSTIDDRQAPSMFD